MSRGSLNDPEKNEQFEICPPGLKIPSIVGKIKDSPCLITQLCSRVL